MRKSRSTASGGGAGSRGSRSGASSEDVSLGDESVARESAGSETGTRDWSFAKLNDDSFARNNVFRVRTDDRILEPLPEKVKTALELSGPSFAWFLGNTLMTPMESILSVLAGKKERAKIADLSLVQYWDYSLAQATTLRARLEHMRQHGTFPADEDKATIDALTYLKDERLNVGVTANPAHWYELPYQCRSNQWLELLALHADKRWSCGGGTARKSAFLNASGTADGEMVGPTKERACIEWKTAMLASAIGSNLTAEYEGHQWQLTTDLDAAGFELEKDISLSRAELAASGVVAMGMENAAQASALAGSNSIGFGCFGEIGGIMGGTLFIGPKLLERFFPRMAEGGSVAAGGAGTGAADLSDDYRNLADKTRGGVSLRIELGSTRTDESYKICAVNLVRLFSSFSMWQHGGTVTEAGYNMLRKLLPSLQMCANAESTNDVHDDRSGSPGGVQAVDRALDFGCATDDS